MLISLVGRELTAILNQAALFRMLIFHRIITTSIAVQDFIFICLMAETRQTTTLPLMTIRMPRILPATLLTIILPIFIMRGTLIGRTMTRLTDIIITRTTVCKLSHMVLILLDHITVQQTVKAMLELMPTIIGKGIMGHNTVADLTTMPQQANISARPTEVLIT
jgi:hypothetical protein